MKVVVKEMATRKTPATIKSTLAAAAIVLELVFLKDLETLEPDYCRRQLGIFGGAEALANLSR